MEDDEFIHDAFTSNRLWKPSVFFQETDTYESALFAPLQLDVPSIKFDHPYAPKETLDRELRLPDLESFEFGPLPELESFDESSVSLDTPLPEEPEDDLWKLALDLGPANKDVLFFTWEKFENAGHVEHHTPYVTERGSAAFDAVLAQDEGKLSTGKTIGSNILLESLWNLGLGRSSLLFSYSPKSRTFQPAIQNGRASGTSLRGAQSLINQFVYIGNTSLYLRSFVERTFASASSIPARVALATSISSILSTFEEHLGRHSGKIRSLLQLQRLFAKPRVILAHVARMVDMVKHAKTNEQLSSTLHQRMLEMEQGDEYLHHLSCEILRRVAKPSLELLGEWIGIQKEQEIIPIPERSSFVAVEDNPENNGPTEYIYRSEMMPKFISPEDGSAIFETGNSLRFLKSHHSSHPLASLEKCGIEPPELEWNFGWRDIETISSKAKSYEQQLRTAILEFTKGTGKPMRVSDASSSQSNVQQDEYNQAPGPDYDNYFEESIRTLDAPPHQPLPDELLVLMNEILTDRSATESLQSSDFSPPLSITTALSFRPLLVAQAKLVNATTLRLFFRSHQLRLHLSLQRQYHLLGDGVFSSRLASALFDPDRESAERHKGRMRSGVHMGLQLGTRTSWPPASSELRLALMGVLSESYYSSALYYSSQQTGKFGFHDRSIGRKENDELPGQLNFAVRQLTEPEMEKIMDPDALYALDFLRLQYVPPSPLNLVITGAALDKYDTIFKFLLRLLRMVFVVAHLPRQYQNLESRQFRMEAHHFVTALSNYIFQTGIADQWNVFQRFVIALESRLQDEDDAGELGTRVTEGIASLRDAHEKCLDSIMFSLLLRSRQRKVMALVEEIFDYVLLFAKMQNPDAKVEHNVKDLYAKMKGKIRVFLSVCRGLTGKKGYGKGKGTAEENSIERLVVSLEMNGYFAR